MPRLASRSKPEAALTTAIEMYRSMAMTFWLPEAEAALAKVEGDERGKRALALWRDFSPNSVTSIQRYMQDTCSW